MASVYNKSPRKISSVFKVQIHFLVVLKYKYIFLKPAIVVGHRVPRHFLCLGSFSFKILLMILKILFGVLFYLFEHYNFIYLFAPNSWKFLFQRARTFKCFHIIHMVFVEPPPHLNFNWKIWIQHFHVLSFNRGRSSSWVFRRNNFSPHLTFWTTGNA